MLDINEFSNRAIGILFLGFIVMGFLFFAVPNVSAQVLSAQPAPAGLPGSSFDLDGYLWSSTIGWVSLNCRTGSAVGGSVCGTSNYKVVVDSSSGELSGYAWSNNIGWIRFGGLGNYPTEDGNTRLNAMMSGNYSSMTLYGWARACAGTDSAPGTCNNPQSGSWDGWISLRGTAPDYGISTNRTRTTGAGIASTSFAWGSTVVGWIGFDLITLLLPTATLTGTGCTIALGASTCAANLSWEFSTDPTVVNRNIRQTSPVVVNNIGGATPPNVGSAAINLTDGGNVIRAYSASTELAMLTLTGSCDAPNDFFTPPGICDQLPPTVTISTNKEVVRSGETVTISWTITPPTGAVTLSPTTSCRVYGPGMPAGVQGIGGGSSVSLTINNATEFSVICNGTFSASMGPADARVSVEVVPVNQEI
jgi:hypothetical protein